MHGPKNKTTTTYLAENWFDKIMMGRSWVEYCRQHLRAWTSCQNSSYDAVQPITIVTIIHT